MLWQVGAGLVILPGTGKHQTGVTLSAISAIPPDRTRVAIVEDDDELRELMVSDLAERGLAVQGLASAEALYRHLSVQDCDIVVLDVGLPGENGYSVARHLRQISSVGIVMLTGRGSRGDMVHGLDNGADLYLVKPVDLDVLAAHVSSLVRRLAANAAMAAIPAAAAKISAPQWSLGAGGWSLCPPHGSAVALSEAERAFLQPLFAAPGTPVSRETLIRTLSDDPWHFDPHRLEVLLHRLRTRVKAATGLVLPVRAVRGTGYLFTG
ncbi:DNA-binding response regulator, OmpR family, contains REC and winged-helix (wHTH) domain [Pseudoxanthomonas wuyuanensis]|uniref:DNA-binding response regulator, OmpR family, contains REC and winged-helix (WHTH) domain n=1 Tax=Pseudoxanthomonas wuyuanensis TaxID=1073196 RepID=A0A286D5Y3_9GAMM|nr:DNA-binding response regulator, OmpR family, contains REC and winged-helix (wHTH) domain [Pseudoxanthomonas wuyuanensis]